MPVFDGKRELLDAFRRGDRAALTAVYQFYVDEVATLLRCGFRMTAARVTVPGERDPQRQLDLLQEAFARAFAERSRLAFDGLSPFRPWLLRIAKNLLIDEGRRTSRLAELPEPSDDDLEVLPVSPEEELEWNRLRTATVAYCQGLDATRQRLVALRFTEDRSQVEVAAALGITRRRVRTLEAEVREGLRKHLADQGLGRA